ncbi:hypothetical protein RJ641_033678 [Dillenia turbinata]|uniref:Uncharacterized protein n=1 Tax=Dillenia turbinata TaxID=194707 RepID=A0AAN8ZJR6_9MAGN
MYLKKPFWSSDANSSSDNTETESSSSAAAAVVSDLISSLNTERLYRIYSSTSYRTRGLRSLLKFLKSVAQSDTTINLFCYSQSITELQVMSYLSPHAVVPVLFENSFKQSEDQVVTNLDQIFTVEPAKITSPSTDAKVALALRVLMNILSNRGVLEQGACLDALIAVMLDSSANQMDFEACSGIEEVAELIRDKQVDDGLRMKCGEFLLLLIGHVNGWDGHPMTTINDDVRRLLGERAASLIWAAGQFGSTLDPEQRLTALQILARRGERQAMGKINKSLLSI